MPIYFISNDHLCTFQNQSHIFKHFLNVHMFGKLFIFFSFFSFFLSEMEIRFCPPLSLAHSALHANDVNPRMWKRSLCLDGKSDKTNDVIAIVRRTNSSGSRLLVQKDRQLQQISRAYNTCIHTVLSTPPHPIFTRYLLMLSSSPSPYPPYTFPPVNSLLRVLLLLLLILLLPFLLPFSLLFLLPIPLLLLCSSYIFPSYASIFHYFLSPFTCIK